MSISPTFKPLGDRAVLVEIDASDADDVNQVIFQLHRKLIEQTDLPIEFAIPAINSLTIGYLPEKIDYHQICNRVVAVLDGSQLAPAPAGNTLRLPVCYAPRYALDIDALIKQTGLNHQEIVDRHQAVSYRALMLGFLPGFAYLGTLDRSIRVPRKPSPRTQVPAGSVAIAGDQTCVYPVAAPGGWTVIGRTPASIVLLDSEQPFLISPGDKIEFYSISETEFATIKAHQESQ